LYFAFGDACKLHKELTTEEQVQSTTQRVLKHQTSSIKTSDGDGDGNDDETTTTTTTTPSETGSEFSEYTEKAVHVHSYESKPGTIYADIDKDHASFIVASNPLTKTHTWHAMPKNSIMWYQRGSLPELRLLRSSSSLLHSHSRKRAISYVLSDSWRPSDILQHGN
jgi:predicted glutamine amidotransferase